MKLSNLTAILIMKIEREDLEWYELAHTWGFPKEPGETFIYQDEEGFYYILQGK